MDRSTKKQLTTSTQSVVHVNNHTCLKGGKALYTNLFTKEYVTIRNYTSNKRESECFAELYKFTKTTGDPAFNGQSSLAGDETLIKINDEFRDEVAKGTIGIQCDRGHLGEFLKTILQPDVLKFAVIMSTGGLGSKSVTTVTPTPSPASETKATTASTTSASAPTPPSEPAIKTPVPTTPFEDSKKEAERQKNLIKSKYTAQEIKDDEKLKVTLAQKIIDFFKEFGFQPGNRYINTIAWRAHSGGNQTAIVKAVNDYTNAYFKVSNNPSAEAIKDKIKSVEWTTICMGLNKTILYNQVNKRLKKISFGQAGSGKTTKIMEQYPDILVMVARPDMLPGDLLEDFDYVDNNKDIIESADTLLSDDLLEVTTKSELKEQLNEIVDNLPEEEKAVITDNKPVENMNMKEIVEAIKTSGSHPKFIPSVLLIAMKEGKKVLIDEINLFQLTVLRTLQGYLDNKNYFYYKGEKIFIHDGFEVYATMNLSDNGEIWPLPTALVDRAADIEEFVITAKQIAEYAF